MDCISGIVPRTNGPRRGGFTLVELLVVIAIIGVLVALLIPVLGRAQNSAKQGAIVNEITAIGQGLQSLRTQFQADFPPDFAVNPATNVAQTKKAQVDQFMSRIYRFRIAGTPTAPTDPNADIPRRPTYLPTGEIDPNGTWTPDANWYMHLDASEALVLWLRGFTDDKQHPLFGRYIAGDITTHDPRKLPRTPLFEFNKAQLRDYDQDGFDEYYPKYGNQQPYVYLVNYNYKIVMNAPAYIVASQPQGLGFGWGPQMAKFPPKALPRPYLSRSNPAMKTINFAAKDNSAFMAPDSFQIICAGLDNDFGPQVNLTGGFPFLDFAYPIGPYPVVPTSAGQPHLDNITNFSAKTLESSMP